MAGLHMKPPPPGGRTPFAKTSRRCYRSAPAHGQRRCPAPSAPKSPATPRCHRSAPANCQRRCPAPPALQRAPPPSPLASFLDPGQPSPRGLHSGGLVAVLFAPAILEDPTLAGTPQARPAQDLGAASLHRHKGLAEALALDLRQEGGEGSSTKALQCTQSTHTHRRASPGTQTQTHDPKHAFPKRIPDLCNRLGVLGHRALGNGLLLARPCRGFFFRSRRLLLPGVCPLLRPDSIDGVLCNPRSRRSSGLPLLLFFLLLPLLLRVFVCVCVRKRDMVGESAEEKRT